jgi:hypothetical protein
MWESPSSGQGVATLWPVRAGVGGKPQVGRSLRSFFFQAGFMLGLDRRTWQQFQSELTSTVISPRLRPVFGSSDSCWLAPCLHISTARTQPRSIRGFKSRPVSWRAGMDASGRREKATLTNPFTLFPV